MSRMKHLMARLLFYMHSVRRRLPFPRQALCLGKLVRGHPDRLLYPECQPPSIALRSGKVRPHVREHVVRRDALAIEYMTPRFH